MKQFIFSIVIMLCIIAISAANGYATVNAADALFSSLDNLNEKKSAEAFEVYLSSWNRYSFYFDLTLPKQRSERIEEGICMLRAAINANDPVAFEYGVEFSRIAIKAVKESNELRLKNIL